MQRLLPLTSLLMSLSVAASCSTDVAQTREEGGPQDKTQEWTGGATDPTLDLTSQPSLAQAETEALAKAGGLPGGASRSTKDVTLYVVKANTPEFPKKIEDTLASFQGLVNRGRKAKLFLVRDPESDGHWLEQIREAGVFAKVVDVSTLSELFAVPAFEGAARGLVVHSQGPLDAKIGLNNAVMIASLKDSLLVEESQKEMFVKRGFKVVADLTGKWRARSNDKAERNANELRAFRYAKEVLQPKMTKGLLGTSTGGFGKMKGIDYWVKHRYFIMHLDAKEAEVDGHFDDQKTLLKRYPVGTVSLGQWTNEVPDVRLLNEAGHTRMGEGLNVSVHESIAYPKPPPVHLREGRNLAEGPDDDKVYVLMSFTQGDALSFCAKDNLHNLEALLDDSYDKSLKGKKFKAEYSFALQHSTLQWGFQRLVLQGLHSLKTGQQDFMAKPFGYSKATTLEKKGHLDIHLAKAKPLIEATGLRDIFINDGLLYENPAVIDKYVEKLSPRSVFTKHSIYKKRCINREPTLVKGVPFFTDPIIAKTLAARLTDLSDDELAKVRVEERRQTTEFILESAKHRRFFWVFIDHTGSANDFAAMMEMVKKRNPKVQFVNMADLIATFKASPEAKKGANGDDFDCIPETNPAALDEGGE